MKNDNDKLLVRPRYNGLKVPDHIGRYIPYRENGIYVKRCAHNMRAIARGDLILIEKKNEENSIYKKDNKKTKIKEVE